MTMRTDFGSLPIIFVVGNPRSGTTMLSRILGNHAEVFTFPELYFFEKMWSPKDHPAGITRREAQETMARLLNRYRHLGPVTRLRKECLREAARMLPADDAPTQPGVYAHFLATVTRQQGKRIPCEQTPWYTYYLGDILKHFDRARIVNMVRDPRDVLLSQKKKWKMAGRRKGPLHALRIYLNYHPLTTSLLWKGAVRAAMQHRDDPRVMHVKYEDMLADPEGTARSICAFLGLTFQAQMLDIDVGNSSLLPENARIRGIDPGRRGNWKKGLSRTEVYLCQKVTGELMRRWGYESAPVRPNPVSLPAHLLLCPLKFLAVFLLFHGREIKNPFEAIQRRRNRR